ncbi:sensor histidine kinase [Myceligenerans xiligouense]|uniref:histidine kinase n=1 Tax=Myceligenerans xiligouense TaxID=253184 RepID=A0A3N4ZLN1_9MICO|nr:histidine kinase [Myceligenerans xiligouense]RPF21825.1 signal transduction histidine kinase [Myceligenerans xiligouense]
MSEASAAEPTAAGRPSPWVTDVVLALAMALVLAVVIAAAIEEEGRAEPGAYAFAAGLGALVLLRRPAPRLMLVLTVLGTFAYYTLGFVPIGMALPAVAALYSAAELRRTGWAVGAGAVLLAVATYYRVGDTDPSAYLTVYDLLTNVALVAAAIALGVAVRLGREARERAAEIRALTATQEARAAERRMQAERLRIARDLHDAVGHNLSVVALHANVAAEAVGRDDDAALGALAHVRSATSDTLHELRATVKLLRGRDVTAADATDRESDASPGRPGRGAAGLAGIEALVAPARSTGLDVVADVDVPPGSIDAAVDAAASRILTEALTNVLRHAGARRARVAVALAGRGGDRVRIEVSDDGAGSGGAAEGSGISGMRERAALLGGTLRAGDAPGGGFTVVADLPARLDA